MQALQVVSNPKFLMVLCIIAQLGGIYGEMINWEVFGEKVLGLKDVLSNPEIPAGSQQEIWRITGEMAANQGFYNIFIVVGIALALLPVLDERSRYVLGVFALACMAAAGAFGAVTVTHNKIIFALQAVPPIMALLSLRLHGRARALQATG